MKKLMLDVDALEVESFATVAVTAADTCGSVFGRGTIADTVRYTDDEVYTCNPVAAPTADTCAFTCDPTGDETEA